MATWLYNILILSINNELLKKTIFRKGTDYVTKGHFELHYLL